MEKPKNRFIITIPFNNLAFSQERLTYEWIKKRLNLFFKYSFQSLKNQTNQDFLALLMCDNSSMSNINQLLKEHEELPDNIKFIANSEGTKTVNDYIRGGDMYYAIRVDSDNTLKINFIDQLHRITINENTQAILAQRGYVFYEPTKELVYYTQDSPSFYALVYKVSDYMLGKLYLLQGGHMGVSKLNYKPMEGFNYVINIHSQNVSNNSALIRNRPRVLNPQAVLKEFCLEHILKES